MTATEQPRVVAEITAELATPMSPSEFDAFRARVIWFPPHESVTLSHDGHTLVVRAPGLQVMWRERVTQALEIQGIRADITGRMGLA